MNADTRAAAASAAKIANPLVSVTFPKTLSRHEAAFWQPSGEFTRFRSLTFVPGQGRQEVVFEGQPFPLRNYWVFLQSFHLAFDQDAGQLQTIAIDTGRAGGQFTSTFTGEGFTWTLSFSPELILRDAADNPQAELGSLELLVVAEPDQPVLGWD